MSSASGSFHAICQQSGLVFGMGGDLLLLKVEPTRFQREAARLIRHGLKGADCTELFLEGLQEYIEDAQNLQASLIPMSLSSQQGSSDSNRYRYKNKNKNKNRNRNMTWNCNYNLLQLPSKRRYVMLSESFIRMLLGVDSIQHGLMEALLDRILGFLNEGEGDSSTPKIILQQLKWLNNIAEPALLTAKLLEVISLSPVSIQRDIIVAVPEIVPDSEHKTIVDGLIELMESSTELIVPILDALSNLNLQSDILVKARNNVMDKLESAELDDLPVVIKFLLQTVEPDTVGDVIDSLRRHLDFKSISNLQRNSKLKMKVANQTPEVLILDALKTGVRLQKFLTDAWYKALVAIAKANDHKVIDLMVMFILHSVVSLKKKIEALFRKKIIEGMLTKKLLEDTILAHGQSLREFMPTILSISENLLRSSGNHPIVSRAASALYSSSFQISDEYYRQEIVGSLLVHIGSGSNVEIDASLAVLQSIVKASRTALNQYSAFIKCILDYLENMSLEQVRLFFIVLGSLAREDEVSGTSGTLLNELNITIRKQLSNPTESYKRVGVMGAVAMVQAFGMKETVMNGRASSSSSSQATDSRTLAESNPLLKISILYLNMIKDNCHKSATSLSLTYDELAHMVTSDILELDLVSWIKEEFSVQFAGTFVSEESEQFVLQPSRNIGMERWMNLDGPDTQLSINIMPKLCEDTAKDTVSESPLLLDSQDAVICLCSLLKLLQAIEKALSSCGLDDIDGLLGCSITLFKREYLEDISEIYSTEICHTICQGILCAINWFRELSNAFSNDANEQTIARIVLRLKHILELEDIMRHVLKVVPGFQPLEASAIKAKDAPSRTMASLPVGVAIHSAHSKGKSSTRSAMPDSHATFSFKPFMSNNNEAVSYESLAPYLRELELSVFQIFRIHEPITREVYDGSDSLEGEKVQLGYPELRFLLKDLLAKMTFKLPGPPVAAPFGKKPSAPNVNNALLIRMSTMEFVQEVLKVIPHLVVKTRMMLVLLFNDDNNTDVNGNPIDLAVVNECLIMSLKILHTLLSWNELKGSDRKELRMTLLKALAIDTKSAEEIKDIESSINLSAVTVESFKNLSAWRQMMPDFESSAMLLEVLDKILSLVPKNPQTSQSASNFATRVLSERWPGRSTVK
ncbi:Fanconi anemia group D2 protein, partial [Podila epigama]